MNQHYLLGFPFAAPQPYHELAHVGVRGETRDLRDMGLHRHPLSVNLDLFLALDEPPALGSLGLVADEYDCVPLVGQPQLEVMEDPAAGDHPGGGDDDRRPGHRVELARVARGGRDLQGRGEDRVFVVGEELTHFDVMLGDETGVERGRLDAHRAVEKDRNLW